VLDGTINGGNSSGLSTLFPGFSWRVIDSSNNIRFVLSAFAGDARMNVLSAPSLMVLGNQEARIQAGDQVPIATRQQQFTYTTSNVVAYTGYSDTGITLTAKPKINPRGLVTM
jgi:general secretion pathway protein D